MSAPTELAEQVQWLVDRAAISDLLIEFARALDERDWQAYAACYTEDGELDIGPGIRHRGRAGLAEFVAGSMSPYDRTHHLSTNHAISIEGDDATSRSYLVAVHVFDADEPARHADGAGWYDCRSRRTDAGWRLVHVSLQECYVAGEPLAHGEPAVERTKTAR